MNWRRESLRAFFLVGALAANRTAHASVATTFSLPQSPTNVSLVNGLDGYDFTPSADLTVTALGWYDHQGDGLLHDHAVGIYVTATRNLVAPPVTVTSSTPLDASTNFRYAAVVPFTLNAGTTYTLTGYGEGPTFDPYVLDPSGGVAFGPDLAFVRARSGASSGLEFPTTASQVGIVQEVFFGPNFAYTPLPEPTLALAGLAATAMFSMGRRRTRGV